MRGVIFERVVSSPPLRPAEDHTHPVPRRRTGGQVGKAAWGSDIELRSEIYLEMRERFHAPTVLVVVQGGPGTLKTVHEALGRGIPTVLVGGSGGAADLLVEWIAMPEEVDDLRLGEITESERASYAQRKP